MKLGELKKRLDEWGTGADDLQVVLETLSPTNKIIRYEIADLPFVVNPPEIRISFGPEDK